VDVEVDSLYVKRVIIEDLKGYVYIVRVDSHLSIHYRKTSKLHQFFLSSSVLTNEQTYVKFLGW
jgi:hypothetical protein